MGGFWFASGGGEPSETRLHLAQQRLKSFGDGSYRVRVEKDRNGPYARISARHLTTARIQLDELKTKCERKREVKHNP